MKEAFLRVETQRLVPRTIQSTRNESNTKSVVLVMLRSDVPCAPSIRD